MSTPVRICSRIAIFPDVFLFRISTAVVSTDIAGATWKCKGIWWEPLSSSVTLLFYHICSFRQICSSLEENTADCVTSALSSSCLDQLNSILCGTWLKHTARFRRIQRAAARVVLYQHSHTFPLSSNKLLKQFDWLPVEWRISFKLATLTFKALDTGRPPYLSDLLQHHIPTRSLHSSSSHQLSVPRHNLTFGSCAFQFSAPRVRNSLPVSIHESQSLPTFRHHLKHFTFSQPTPFQLPTLLRISLSMCPDSSKTLVLYKSCTYLLTLAQSFSQFSLISLCSFSWLQWWRLAQSWLTMTGTSILSAVWPKPRISSRRRKFLPCVHFVIVLLAFVYL